VHFIAFLDLSLFLAARPSLARGNRDLWSVRCSLLAFELHPGEVPWPDELS
jgi:hypothetical protein